VTANGQGAVKVVLFDGSAHPGSSIAGLLSRLHDALVDQGVHAEQVRLQVDPRTGCCLCCQCAHKPDASCHRPPQDGLRRCLRKLQAADGIVIGSPAYIAGVSPATQRLMARVGQSQAQDGESPLARKVAAAVVDVRNQLAPHTLASITRWFHANEMIVVGESAASGGAGAPASPKGDGDQAEDMADLGRTMALALRRLES
jgi:multimeric flavodoxin WrbA